MWRKKNIVALYLCIKCGDSCSVLRQWISYLLCRRCRCSIAFEANSSSVCGIRIFMWMDGFFCELVLCAPTPSNGIAIKMIFTNQRKIKCLNPVTEWMQRNAMHWTIRFTAAFFVSKMLSMWRVILQCHRNTFFEWICREREWLHEVCVQVELVHTFVRLLAHKTIHRIWRERDKKTMKYKTKIGEKKSRKREDERNRSWTPEKLSKSKQTNKSNDIMKWPEWKWKEDECCMVSDSGGNIFKLNERLKWK